MSLSSISRAAMDSQLIDRVTAAAHHIIVSDADKANTVFAQSMINGYGSISTLMWPVAIDTEGPYESALLSLRGAPGFDKDIITDGQIMSSVDAHWPMARPVAPLTPPA